MAVAAIASSFATGCVHASFVKTSEDYEAHAVDDVPEVFVDHLPDRPYTAVGIIEVRGPQSTSLSEVLRTAASKGQQVGCDVVVDRSIHQVGEVPARRWSVLAVVEPDLREEWPARSHASPYLGMPGASPSRTVSGNTVIVNNGPLPSEPLDKREFVCGIFRAGGAPPAPPSAPVAKATPASAPTGAGGFAFLAVADDVRRTCEQSGHVYAAASGSVRDSCDGLPSSIGTPARATFAYCDGKLCEISLRVDLPAGTALGPSLTHWRQALTERYGKPASTRSEVPSECATDVTPCLTDGRAHIGFGWLWPTGESIAVVHGVDAGGPHVRLTYALAVAKAPAPGL